ncbi:MAG TPA: NepR family anti-sigma factor [Methylocystis sp.]
MRWPRLERPKVGDEISELLRQTYDDVLREPLPDRLRDLLERLDRDRPLFFGEARAPDDSAAAVALTQR